MMPGTPVEAAEAHDGRGVASGDHRDLRAALGQRRSASIAPATGREACGSGDERGERAVEVGRDQHVGQGGPQGGGDLGQVHPSILPLTRCTNRRPAHGADGASVASPPGRSSAISALDCPAAARSARQHSSSVRAMPCPRAAGAVPSGPEPVAAV